MPRLRYIEEAEKTSRDREMIESAKRTGAPDPRVVSIIVLNPKAGAAWVEYWNTALPGGSAAQAQGDVPYQDFSRS
jgi:hypothetical protein